MSVFRVESVIFALLTSFFILGCELETNTRITDLQTGESYTIGRQGRTDATSDICANEDYVSHPISAAQRASECYNRGQKEAFALLFEYSGGTVYTGYFLEETKDKAIAQSKQRDRRLLPPVAVFIENGKAYLVQYNACLSNCNGTSGTIEVYMP